MSEVEKQGIITMSTPTQASTEARRRMAREGVRRLHEWLRHQSRHEGADEMDTWVPDPAPKATSQSKWVPVYSHGVILRWEKAMFRRLVRAPADYD